MNSRVQPKYKTKYRVTNWSEYDRGLVQGGDIHHTRTASVSGGKPRSAERDKAIKRVGEVGRRRWKRKSGYHRQGTVENVFFRY